MPDYANRGMIAVLDEYNVARAIVGVELGQGSFIGEKLSISPLSSGNDLVELPDSSIDSREMLDEPGITSSQQDGDLVLNSTTYSDITTTSIQIPAAGYIVVTGQAYIRLSGTTSENGANIQIDETAGGTLPHATSVSVTQNEFGSTESYRFPVSVHRIYYKSSPGSYEFRLEGKQETTNGAAGAFRGIITCMYFATSYGTVEQTIANNDDLQQSQSNLEQGNMSGNQSEWNKVDLRILELRTAKLKAQALEAEIELLKAKTRFGSSLDKSLK